MNSIFEQQLGKLIKLNNVKIIEKPNKKIVCTSIFLPEYPSINMKTSVYILGLIKTIETFSKNIGKDWILRVYYDSMFDTGIKLSKFNFSTPVTQSLINQTSPDSLTVLDIECFIEPKRNELTMLMSYDYVDNNMRSVRVAKFNLKKIDNDYEFSNWKVLNTSKAWKDNGASNSAGRLKLLKSGDLLLSIQKPSKTHIGASDGYTLKIDINKGLSSIYTFGHRNIQGISEDRDGVIYATEQGPMGGDELNVLSANSDYGWPTNTHGSDGESYSWKFSKNELFGRHDNAKVNAPIFSWVPSIAISNLIHLENFHKYWDGDIILGSLKSRSIFRIRVIDQKVIFVERIWIGERIRDIAEASGKIILFTDSLKIKTLSIFDKKLASDRRVYFDVRNISLKKCVNCHHFGATNESHSAPSLTNIFGRNIAGDSFTKYSNGLISKNDNTWNASNLKDFLRNPNKFAPGTYMPYVDLKEDENSAENFRVESTIP